MCSFHLVCQEVLYCSVVQGHYHRGRQSGKVSEWRWGPQTPIHGCWFNWGDCTTGRDAEEVPPQGYEDLTIRLEFFQVNTTFLWRWSTCSPVLTFNCPLDFSCSINSDTVAYEDSCLIVRYLASMRPFSQSFDIYLSQVGGFISNERQEEITLCLLWLTYSLFHIDSESAGGECHRSPN